MANPLIGKKIKEVYLASDLREGGFTSEELGQ